MIRFARILLSIASALTEAAVDWRAQLEGIGAGDVACLARVRRLVTGQLMSMGAFSSSDSSWDDLAQEVIVRVWRSHRDQKIRDYRALPGFVRTMTRRAAIDRLRKTRRELPLEDERGETVEPEPTGEADRLEPAQRLLLQKALDILPEKQRAVIDRIYLKGMTYDEAAESLEMPRGSINRLQREAMQRLRKELMEPDTISAEGSI